MVGFGTVCGLWMPTAHVANPVIGHGFVEMRQESGLGKGEQTLKCMFQLPPNVSVSSVHAFVVSRWSNTPSKGVAPNEANRLQQEPEIRRDECHTTNAELLSCTQHSVGLGISRVPVPPPHPRGQIGKRAGGGLGVSGVSLN